MRPNKLRKLLSSGQPTIGTRLHSYWPGMVEVVGHTGVFDYVEFSAEYAPFDLHDLDNFCRACELHDLGSIIKIDQEPRGFLAGRGIGSGFEGVLFADCRTVDDARECISVVRPDTPKDGGVHGVAMRRKAYMSYGGSEEYVQSLRDVIVALMIEKRGSVEQLENILSLGEIDLIQWGPSDYTMSIGRFTGTPDPEVKATERQVIETCLAMGVPPRAEINTPDQAKYYLDMGVRHFNIGMDVRIVHDWLKANGEGLRLAVEGS